MLCRGASQLRIRKLANATAASITCVSMVAFTQARSPLAALALHTALVLGNSFDYCGWFPNSKDGIYPLPSRLPSQLFSSCFSAIFPQAPDLKA